jgi:hypothetical protein
MSTSIQEVVVENKPVILSKNEYFSGKEIPNTIEITSINDELNQFEKFKTYISRDYFNNSITDEQKETVLKTIYLNTYKNVINTFFQSQNQSVFLKTKEQLNLNFDGGQLLQNLNFFDVLDIQQLKEEIINTLTSDPCLMMNIETNSTADPIQMELIKGNMYLGMRSHILDFKLRSILLTSVFDNTQFYNNDNTLVNYLFSLYVERIKKISNKYYINLREILLEQLQGDLENGSSFIDPITNKEIVFLPFSLQNKNENFVIYLQYLFNEQFVITSNNLNNFFKLTISKDDVSFKLSNLLNPKDYFVNNLEIVSEFGISTLKPSTLAYYIGIETRSSSTILDMSLIIKTDTFASRQDYIELVKSQKLTINRVFSSINDVSDEIKDLLKTQILQKQQTDTLFKFVFPIEKILNFVTISTILMCSNYYQNCNTSFDPSVKTTVNIHNSIIDQTQDDECETIDLNLSFGFNAEILKIIAQTPVTILKSIEETYDPNIAIASKLKKAAESVGTPDASIIPYSFLLMTPPPFGPSIPVVAPWGYIYWGISAGEAVTNFTKNGLNGLDVDINTEADNIKPKNPFKPLC